MSVDRYLRVKQVVELTGLSRATIYNMEKAGAFPNKIALGARAVAWRESEIAYWLESRKTVQKVGREAKPGRPPTSSAITRASAFKKPAALEALSSSVETASHRGSPAPALATSDDIWEDDPLPSDEELDRQRSERMLRASKARQPQADFLKRSSTRFNLTTAGTVPKKPARIVVTRDFEAPRKTGIKKR